MNVLVTGQPGVGKTTLIMKVYERLKEAYPHLLYQGFYTEEVRRGGERIGFDVVTLDGRRGPLARVGGVPDPQRSSTGAGASSSGSAGGSRPAKSLKSPTVGKYVVDVSQFEQLALPELEVGANSGFVVIDEVGKMELFSPSFFPSVLRALDSPCLVLASVPVPRYGRDIPQVAAVRSRKDVVLHTLSKANRDDMADQVFRQLSAAIASMSSK